MSEKLWGGRFAADITSEVLDYTMTVDVDTRLVAADVWQDIAHTLMLGRAGIVAAEPVRAILGALLRLHDAGEVPLRPEFEDVHLNVEQLVIADVGREHGGHMHTGRSRNDQVATDTRVYLREAVLDLVDAALDLVDELLTLRTGDDLGILPGYTHSQAAQPITVAFWRTAHASMVLRDVRRLRDTYARLDESPLGAGALAGTSFPLDRGLTAALLGFPSVLAHALDATSARDHLLELAAVLAVGANSLSRMAEEIVLWSGHEYALCEVADEYATGSSIMPQKKNPVVAELVRARCGRNLGALVQMFTAVKGVTLGYSCDLQEDKPQLWGSIDGYLASLRIVTGQTRGLRFDTARGEELCWQNFSTATELANHLVVADGLDFRQAHRVTGEVVAALLAEGATLRDTDRVAKLVLDAGHAVPVERLDELLDPRSAVRSYTSPGGTSPASVAAVHAELTADGAGHRDWGDARRRHVRRAREVTLATARAVAAGSPIDGTVDAAAAELGVTR